MSGSSPLARGTPGHPLANHGKSGLIPARAGNTYGAFQHAGRQAAHPRSRGEHYWCLLLKPLSSGSSPLARGTPQMVPSMICHHGLIPARAGNTRKRYRATVKAGAHPRSRGEHTSSAGTGTATPGSSPLARGTRTALHSRPLDAGLIPARAGNTRKSSNTPQPNRAHPRSRGEHVRRALDVASLPGSSPLARGTPNEREHTRSASGLIPARAGNTKTKRRVRGTARAHPRSRGEHND